MDSTPAEHAIVVPRTARYYTLGPPLGALREIWIVCHGYGQLAGRFVLHFSGIDTGTRLIVAPEALSRFYLDPIAQRRHEREPRIGATWMTREDRDHEIADHVGYLDRVALDVMRGVGDVTPRLVVLGFSQGTATVSRWLDRSSIHADDLVLWSGGLPPELDLAAWAGRLGGTRITLVAGDADELAPSAMVAAEANRLASAGVPHVVQRFAGGHTIDGDALRELAARLAEERQG